MTLFEYLAIAFSLLYSTAALRLVGGLPHAMTRGPRYSVHLAATIGFLLATIASFWTLWSLRGVDWTFPGFLLALAIPGALYFCAATLIPNDPEDVESWRDHYYAVHRRLWGGLAIFGVVAAASATVNIGMPPLHPARIVQGGAVALGVLGAASASHRVHTGIMIAVFGLAALWAVTAGLTPEWLAH